MRLVEEHLELPSNSVNSGVETTMLNSFTINTSLNVLSGKNMYGKIMK
jgi:hypothetical protein